MRRGASLVTFVGLVALGALVALGGLGTLGGCYGATPSPGAPCGPGGECPTGLSCDGEICVLPGTGVQDAASMLDDGMIVPPDGVTVPGAWSAPVRLMTGVLTESDPSMTQDRLTIVFMSELDEDLYIATRATPTGALSATELGALNSGAREKSPEISPDGRTIYFTSDRGGNFDVYRSTLTIVWSPPALVSELSTAGNDGDIAISPDGLTAVVIRDENTNRFVVHTRASTSQAFGVGRHRPELSNPVDATAPTITNGGAIIYFHGGPSGDLYRATRKMDGTYTAPELVSELNSAQRDAAPFVLQDDKHLIFERATDLYETSRP